MINLKYKRLTFLAIAFTVASVALILYLGNTKAILKLLYPLKYQEEVYRYSERFDLDPLLVFSIIKVESSFDRYAVSQKGAKGLMQVTDKTGAWAAETLNIKDYSSINLFDPNINILIGCWYLDRLRMEFKGDLRLAITAYNGGSGRVQEWLKNKELSSDGKSLDKIPFPETEKYMERVLKEYKIIRYIYASEFKQNAKAEIPSR